MNEEKNKKVDELMDEVEDINENNEISFESEFEEVEKSRFSINISPKILIALAIVLFLFGGKFFYDFLESNKYNIVTLKGLDSSYDYADAFLVAKEILNKGDSPDAECHIAKYYMTGVGTQKNIDLGLDFFVKGMKGRCSSGGIGFEESFSRLDDKEKLSLVDKNDKKILEIIKYYSKSGNDNVAVYYAEFYKEMLDLRVDEKVIINIADNVTSVNVDHVYAYIYMNGNKLSDYSKGWEYLLKSASSGNYASIYKVGELHLNGYTSAAGDFKITRDIAKGLNYLIISVYKGNYKVAKSLGDRMVSGDILLTKNYSIAVELYEIAIKEDDTLTVDERVDVLDRLMYMYSRGLGTEKNQDKFVYYAKLRNKIIKDKDL
jgi:TPR repeat protein